MVTSSQNLKNTVKSDSEESFFKCRYVIAFMGFLIFLVASIQRHVISVAIVAMVNNTITFKDAKSDSCPNLILNATKNESSYMIKEGEGEFDWSPRVQGYVLGSFCFGVFVMQIPSGLLAERYGCKWLLFTSSLLCSLLTLLVPPISWWSMYGLIAVQVMRGLSQGILPSSMAILTSNWFPKSERGFLYAFMMSAISLGTFLGSILTGYICDSSLGWSYSFYVFGIAGLALSFCIAFSIAENPRVHSTIPKAELDFILNNQECILNRKRPKQPWSTMLTSIPVYAFAFGYFGHIWAAAFFWTVQSTFLGTVLHYPIAVNGVFTAISFLIQFFCSHIAAGISFHMQNRNVASVDFIRKFWTYVSGLGFSGCLLGMYFVGCNRSYSILFSTLSMGFSGMGSPGIFVVATDMTPTFAGSLHALVCTSGYTACFIIPIIVGYLTNEMQIIEQWNKVFFISIGVVMLSNTVFILFGSADIQPWNFVEEETKDEAETQTEDFKIYDKDHKYEKTTCF